MTQTFWNLSHPNTSRYLAEWTNGENRFDANGCKRLTDLKITVPGKSVQDFVWTWYNECCVQDHVLQAFREQGFTGFDIKPVKARFKDDPGVVPCLWEMAITGWGGMASPKSGIFLDEQKSNFPEHHFHYTGTDHPESIIDEQSWDGSDFFIVWPMPKFIFVSDRAGRFIKASKFSGATIIRPEEMRKFDGFSPGRLSYYMPDARAKVLGEPLGIY